MPGITQQITSTGTLERMCEREHGCDERARRQNRPATARVEPDMPGSAPTGGTGLSDTWTGRIRHIDQSGSLDARGVCAANEREAADKNPMRAKQQKRGQ